MGSNSKEYIKKYFEENKEKIYAQAKAYRERQKQLGIKRIPKKNYYKLNIGKRELAKEIKIFNSINIFCTCC